MSALAFEVFFRMVTAVKGTVANELESIMVFIVVMYVETEILLYAIRILNCELEMLKAAYELVSFTVRLIVVLIGMGLDPRVFRDIEDKYPFIVLAKRQPL